MSRVGRAANLAGARRRQPRFSSVTRNDIVYAQDSERMAHVVAGMFCTSCGVTVGADGLHDWQCIDVPRDRRRTE